MKKFRRVFNPVYVNHEGSLNIGRIDRFTYVVCLEDQSTVLASKCLPPLSYTYFLTRLKFP
jgi:hypothetical protein